MPTTNIGQRVARITGLSPGEVQELNTAGIVNEDDLSFISFEDVPETIPIVKRRKLELVSNYLRADNVPALTGTTTIREIQVEVTNQTRVIAAGRGAIAAGVGGGTLPEDRGAPKLYTDPLPKFSGNPVDYEEWERKAGATIRQTAYKHYITRQATAGNPVETARSSELYNMILSCVGDGHALNTVEKVKDANAGVECGHLAWKALKDWYMDETQINTMIAHYEAKLKGLFLDRDTTATEYINNFELYVRKLEKLEGVWSDDKKVREFKDRITDADYDTETRVHTGDFNSLVKSFRSREQDLEKRSNQDKRQRRFKANSDDELDKEDVKQGGNNYKPPGDGKERIPFIPKFLYRSLDTNGKRNIAKWRSLVNQGKTMAASDLVKDNESKDTGSDKDPPKKRQRHNNSKKQRRVTKTASSGTVDDTLMVKLDSDNGEYFADSNCLPSTSIESIGDDSKHTSNLHQPVSNEKRVLRRFPSVGESSGRRTRQAYTVVDTGAVEELVGGIGWHILHVSNKTETLSGALEGMGTRTLPKVDAVTAVEDENGEVILLGVGNATYDRRIAQYESLWNSHHLRFAGIIVDDTSKSHGGEQCIKIKRGGDWTVIPLKFDGHIMTVNLREPTTEELESLGITWIKPAMADHSTQSLRRRSIVLEQPQLQVPDSEQTIPEEEQPANPTNNAQNSTGKHTKDWRSLLGYPSEKVLEKTLVATTQLCAEPVEAERREIPRQHRKKRLLPLHPRRLKGRVDSDTFFSTVLSKRNYKCVQFFVHVPSDYIFVRCMQRESHSHGAYQDFIREIGAPNMLITDNSQTQTGEKWESTSRSIMTKQRTFAPHNQNQSMAERRIGVVKHKTVHVLSRSGAPLLFWCYALIFVVDCLNHIAKKTLGWRTSTEVLNGDTADISAFRFSFWEPIEYLEPTAKFPQSRWGYGRFIGIAWDSGDMFTFKIWTEPDGDWTKGLELVRNIVRSRSTIMPEPAIGEPEDMSQFKFQRKVATRKRKGRNKTTVYKLQDVPEQEEADDEMSIGENEERQRIVRFDEHPQILGEDKDSEEAGGNQIEAEQDTHNSYTNTTNNKKSLDLNNEETNPGASINPQDMGEIEMSSEINDELSRPDESPTIGGTEVKKIISHEWKLGHPSFKVQWGNGDETWALLRDMRQDHPRMTAKYIVDNKVSRSKRGGDRVLQWAKKVVRDMDRAIRRIVRLYDTYLDEDDNIRRVRRTVKGNKKRKKPPSTKVFKYGIQVPRSVTEAISIDEKNGNTYWQDAMRLEVGALVDLDCFEFKPEGYHPGSGYQKTTLHMVFDVKHDLRRKARLVAGGHLIDIYDTPVYSSTVKSISVRLLHVIAHKAKLELLCGDIGNAFPNAYTNEKVYVSRAGPEFGKYAGMTIIIRKALYGLASSSERFHSHLADTLRSFGFKQTRFDNDVWIRKDEVEGMYEYICTHVDDFMIVARRPQRIMESIESVYLVKGSSKGPPEYYLGNDFKKDKKGRWCFGCKTYLKEAISRVEHTFGELPKKDTPMPEGDHPEEDTSRILGDSEHQQYQMLMGILNWVVCLGRIDIAFAVTSLTRFTACPREGHMDRAMRVFGYLKKYSNRRIVVDSRDPILEGGKDALEKDYTKIFKDNYPDSTEEIDAKIPIPLIDELEITTFVDSDHAHDKVTRRSITGIIIIIGRTPVFFSSKRQGAIETSTYGAEFCAMRTAVEEVQSVRYMLRCLGVKVRHSSLVCGDNLGVIQNSTISDSLLKKKHVAIAYHKTREAAAAGIIHPIKVSSKNNFADILTKAVTGKTFWALYGRLTRG